MIFAILVIFC